MRTEKRKKKRQRWVRENKTKIIIEEEELKEDAADDDEEEEKDEYNEEKKEKASASQSFFITKSCKRRGERSSNRINFSSSPHPADHRHTWLRERDGQYKATFSISGVSRRFLTICSGSQKIFPQQQNIRQKGWIREEFYFLRCCCWGSPACPPTRRWPEGDGGHPSARPNEGREDVTPSLAGLTKWRRGYPGVQRLASKTVTGGGKHRHTKNRRATSHSGTQKPLAWGLSTAASMVEEWQRPQSLHYLGILCHSVVNTATMMHRFSSEHLFPGQSRGNTRLAAGFSQRSTGKFCLFVLASQEDTGDHNEKMYSKYFFHLLIHFQRKNNAGSHAYMHGGRNTIWWAPLVFATIFHLIIESLDAHV